MPKGGNKADIARILDARISGFSGSCAGEAQPQPLAIPAAVVRQIPDIRHEGTDWPCIMSEPQCATFGRATPFVGTVGPQVIGYREFMNLCIQDQRFQITPFFEMKSGRGARKQRKERHEGADWEKKVSSGSFFCCQNSLRWYT